MLQSRLILPILAATAIVASCGGGDDADAIRENVVEPGVSAVEEGGGADTAACDIEASTLRTALESFALLEGEPAAAEAARVEAGFLRSESTLWDVVDGELVAQDPGCGAVPTDIEAAEIVTDTDVPSAEEVYTAFTPDEVAAFGGADCAWELAQIYAAGEAFVAATGNSPDDLDTLVADGYLAQEPTLWVFDAGDLAPAEGSDCPDLR